MFATSEQLCSCIKIGTSTSEHQAVILQANHFYLKPIGQFRTQCVRQSLTYDPVRYTQADPALSSDLRSLILASYLPKPDTT